MTNKEEIIYAPIEIESADQLHALGATWADCKTWRIGMTPVKVYLVPADQEVRDYLMQELRKKYSNQNHQGRCKIPGKRKTLIDCPLTNRCASCPYGTDGSLRQGRTVSLDEMLEEGYDQAGLDTASEQAENRIELEHILRCLREENPLYPEIVRMRASGYSPIEISEKIDVNVRTVHRMLQKIRRLASDYLDDDIAAP